MNRWITAFTLTLACCSVARSQSTQPTANVTTSPADVPITTIKLFSSGVGYFERSGLVHDDDHTTLSFKTEQINDILKSLVLQDLDGGTAGMITYPSQDPLEKTLAGYAVDVSNNQSLLDLLTTLRGAHLTVSAGPVKIAGVLLGTETKQLPGIDDKHPIAVESLTLLSGTSIRSIPLDSVGDVQLDDPQLQTDLAAALATLAGARNQNQKPIDIAFHGNGERHVRIGYVVESPVWKTSYRLVLDQEKPRLQGWAMVENQTDSDWKNVQLSMISGRPISFIEDLYTPIYLQRPTVQPNLYGGLQPPASDEGSTLGFGGVPRSRNEMAAAKAMASPAAMGALMDAASFGMTANATVAAMASTASLGQLFSYTVDHVSLPRHQSAMLPVVADAVEAQRLSVFNQQTLATHPLNGVRLKNTTDKHLLQGPITVFDHANYAGDAQLDNLPPGQSRLLSYGIDLDVKINAEKDAKDMSIQQASLVKGVLQIVRRTTSSHDFIIDNQSDAMRTVVIEDPIRPGWSLVDTDKPIEVTADQNRFQLDVPAGKSKTFTVKQEMPSGEQVEILPANDQTLMQFITSGEIPPHVRDALAKVIQLKSAVTKTENEVAENNKKLKSITEEQSRMRDNMKAVDPKSDYYTRLMKKFDTQETTIEQLQSNGEKLQADLTTAQDALNDYIANLNIP